MRPVIPTRKGERRQPGFDKAACRERNRVERPITHLKQFCHIGTRYDKSASTHLAMVRLGIIMLWIPASAERP